MEKQHKSFSQIESGDTLFFIDSNNLIGKNLKILSAKVVKKVDQGSIHTFICDCNGRDVTFAIDDPKSDIDVLLLTNNIFYIKLRIVSTHEDGVIEEFMHQQDIIYCGIQNLKFKP